MQQELNLYTNDMQIGPFNFQLIHRRVSEEKSLLGAKGSNYVRIDG